MDNAIKDIWKTTWESWRNGELNEISNNYREEASVDITRRDGSRSVYKKIETIPSDRAISFALKTCVDSITCKNNERNNILINDSNKSDDNKIIKTEPKISGLGLFAHIDKIIELGFAITFIYLIVKLIILKSK